jgi:hypothetical protein
MGENLYIFLRDFFQGPLRSEELPRFFCVWSAVAAFCYSGIFWDHSCLCCFLRGGIGSSRIGNLTLAIEENLSSGIPISSSCFLRRPLAWQSGATGSTPFYAFASRVYQYGSGCPVWTLSSFDIATHILCSLLPMAKSSADDNSNLWGNLLRSPAGVLFSFLHAANSTPSVFYYFLLYT